MNIDTLIEAQWVIPVVPEGAVLEQQGVAVHNGRILEILPASRARKKYRPGERLALPGHALIPGLINVHTHAAMALLRGLADDLPLMTWLNDHIWPTEARWVSEDMIHDGTQLALLEMIRGGTTCCNDMYFFPDVAARDAAAAGIRATIGLIVLDFPTVWAEDAVAYLEKGLAVHDQFRAHPLVRTAFAPHAPYSVSDAPLQRVATLANELDIPIHMHVHETRDEVLQSLREHSQRPLARLDALGLLSPGLMAVHMTQLETDEIARVAETGTHVVHCPESNLKLASGFSPVAQIIKAGVNVALGTDGAASNNDLDMFGEMRSAALLAKGVARDASAVPAATALRMATLNGAAALGIDTETGSLEAGKSADLVAVDLSRPETQPLYNPISQLVYACGREQVRHVWVAGRQLLRDGRTTTLDAAEILSRAAEWQTRIGGK